MRRILAALALASFAGACATSGGDAKDEVEAVVVDEKARAVAAQEVRRTGDPEKALDAAEDASSREPATTGPR